MEKHWFTLNEDTFLWLKSNMGFAYNATNKKQVLFALTDSIEAICNQLLIPANLYTIELTGKDDQDKEINQWIQSLINIDAGYLTYHVEFGNRPVSLKPILKVQDKKEYYEFKHSKGQGSEILQNLHELTFYITGSEYGNDGYYKQHIFPLKNCSVLDNSKILSFISNSRNPFLSNINLVGNPFVYSGFERLVNDISGLSVHCTAHIMIRDLMDNKQMLKDINWPNHIQFNILIDNVCDFLPLHDISFPFSIKVFVFSDDDYMHFSTMFKTSPTSQDIRFIPLYNSGNLPFFTSKVFMNKEELETIELSKTEIFMRQAFNIGDFGKLTVLPDENVYANVNNDSLGTIKDSPYSIVYKEFIAGQSWFKVRDQVPCKDCIYQWLCPPPSNYEIALEKSNLCHIK